MSTAGELLRRIRSHDPSSKAPKHYFMRKVHGQWRIYRQNANGTLTSDNRVYTSKFAAKLQLDAYTHLEHISGEPRTVDNIKWSGAEDRDDGLGDSGMPNVPLGGVIGS